MALYLITGQPGAGKTYYALQDVLKRYYNYNDGQYEKRPDAPILVTNMEGLSIEHENLEEIAGKMGVTVPKFFTCEIQDKIHKKYPKVVYIIDEAQQYYRGKYYDGDVFYYFERIRHYGDDCYLIAHTRYKIPKDIYGVVEKEIRAIRRSLNIIGELKYNILVDVEKIGMEVLRKDKRVMASYKTADTNESIKMNSPYRKYVIIGLLMILVMIPLTARSSIVKKMFIKEKTKTEKNEDKKIEEKIKLKVENKKEESSEKESDSFKDEYTMISSIVELDGRLYSYVNPITDEYRKIDDDDGVIKKGKRYYVKGKKEKEKLNTNEKKELTL